MPHNDVCHDAGAENEPDPEARFVRVLKYYMSGWHQKPRGVKKPYVSVALSSPTIHHIKVHDFRQI